MNTQVDAPQSMEWLSWIPRLHRGEFTTARLRWLIGLRWFAMATVLLVSLIAASANVSGVHLPTCILVGVAGLAYNWFSARRIGRSNLRLRRRSAGAQALIDILLLTMLLWASGGVHSPFLSFYLFHIALISILGGKRGAWLALLGTAIGLSFLGAVEFIPSLQISVWDRSSTIDFYVRPLAFITTLFGLAYVVSHASMELRDREWALLRARDQVALEYQLIRNILDELHAGLEVLSPDGDVIWRNRRAAALSRIQANDDGWTCEQQTRVCQRETHGRCPVDMVRDGAGSGRCRFSAEVDGEEQVYEMLVFPVDRAEKPRVMNLYVDRTQATISERQLMLAERLASLGRVAQGVAHELNTPLATIRTLSADMKQVIDSCAGLVCGDKEDLAESAALIHDETRRLGSITHALLAGGNLARSIDISAANVGQLVKRAVAIVTAGSRAADRVEIDESLNEVLLEVDSDRMTQILVNLLQNSLDAMKSPSGKVCVSLQRCERHSICLLVDDEGEGIPDEMLGRLFEPFATSKPTGKGTGLGLYTSYMLVKEMGGELSLENRVTTGVRAKLTFPQTVLVEGMNDE